MQQERPRGVVGAQNAIVLHVIIEKKICRCANMVRCVEHVLTVLGLLERAKALLLHWLLHFTGRKNKRRGRRRKNRLITYTTTRSHTKTLKVLKPTHLNIVSNRNRISYRQPLAYWVKIIATLQVLFNRTLSLSVSPHIQKHTHTHTQSNHEHINKIHFHPPPLPS